jgi:hypothetical protein
MDVQLPDGSILQGVPEGTTKSQIAAKLKANGRPVPAEWLQDAPAAASKAEDPALAVGRGIMEIPRQVGLTARAGIKGVLALPGVAVDAVTGPINTVFGTRIPTASSSLDNALSRLGLPEPANATERVVQDSASLMAGAGSMAKGAEALSRGAVGIGKNVLAQMAARPAVQIAGAGASGAAGGSVREAGGGPGAQFLAALGGGIAGGVAADKLIGAGNAAGNALRSMATPKTEQIRAADQQIQLTLERSGIDWSQIPERVRQGLRQEVAQAMNTGQPLNADALRRLVVFRQTKTTPTVGQLTQDPGMITREMNLAKTGANSTDLNLQRLPALQNKNTAQLLSQLDEAGAANAPTATNAARAVIDNLDSNLSRERASVSALYDAARDSGGRSLPLNAGAFNQRASQLLDDANVGSFLPADIRNKLNAIASGQGGFELNVNSAEQLKTSIGRLQRNSSDGNARMALGLVRQALDETPLYDPKVNPGNLPALPGSVPPSTSAAGEASMRAFSEARGANRALMQRIESNPALRAVYEGVEPDQFAQRFIVGKAATAKDVQALRDELSPEATESVRGFLAGYLRDKATGGDRDVVKFGGSTYRAAFREIEEKLGVFFSPEEVAQLKAIGEAAKYMQAQPAGSAVNNSNSGALVLGRGLDLLERIAGKIPLGLKDTIQGTIQGAQQTQVLQPKNALIQIAESQPSPARINPLLAAAVVSPADARENNGRR